MKSRFLAALGMTGVGLGMTAPARAQTTDVALGIEALARRDVKGAEAAFRRGTTADNPLIRPVAWQWLGHVAWKFRGDTTAAKRYLDRALLEARDSSQILLEIARFKAAKKPADAGAVVTAYDAMSRSADAERRGLAARTVVSLAADRALTFVFMVGRLDATSTDSGGVIAQVRDTLAARVRRFPGRTSDAAALVEAAAMLADTAMMRAGLRSYLTLVDAPLARAADSIANDSSISRALARARLYRARALFEDVTEYDRGNSGQVPSEWAGYPAFVLELQRAVELVYRAALAGRAKVGDVQRAFNEIGRRASVWGADVTPYYPSAVTRRLSQRFGTVMTIETSRGMEELSLAHRVGAYRSGANGIVVVDGMMAGVDDWFLDGTGGRAGWVSGDTIYARRTAFTETPFRALLALTDPQTIPGEVFRLSRDSIGDVDRARRDSLGYLPGVAARVFRSGSQALLDSVRTTEAFTRAMFDNLIRTSIVLHESRHRADARSGRASTEADAEFRAKLDEVTGAPLPRLALTAILSPTIGDSSPHGQANRRIMIGLNRWIRRNGASIAGYSALTPALLQLPLLTDAQLKAAFNSMRAR